MQTRFASRVGAMFRGEAILFSYLYERSIAEIAIPFLFFFLTEYRGKSFGSEPLSFPTGDVARVGVVVITFTTLIAIPILQSLAASTSAYVVRTSWRGCANAPPSLNPPERNTGAGRHARWCNSSWTRCINQTPDVGSLAFRGLRNAVV